MCSTLEDNFEEWLLPGMKLQQSASHFTVVLPPSFRDRVLCVAQVGPALAASVLVSAFEC